MVDSQNDIWIGMNYGLLKIKFDHKENIITERHFLSSREMLLVTQ